MLTLPSTLAVARRPRAFVRVAGPDAEALLQRLVSNDVAALGEGESCDALLLTAKARVIAPLRIVRRGPGAFLLLTEPELGDTVRRHLLRLRLASRAEVALEEHPSFLLLGEGAAAGEGELGVATDDYGVPGLELIAAGEPPADAAPLGDEELERLRIRAGTPRFGREVDDRVLPAEAGLVERAVSFTKGCYPGQEPVARLHHRGHANRGLRVLELEGSSVPEYDAEVRLGEKVVGRVTSAVREGDGVVALAYVRVEVPDDAELTVGGTRARVAPLSSAAPRP
ncbi:MAG: folate-binding protein YgfZ [Actinobacteria bacterium]|nr:folate-binding protein YgfZ [Actinomycetota bacterium]